MDSVSAHKQIKLKIKFSLQLPLYCSSDQSELSRDKSLDAGGLAFVRQLVSVRNFRSLRDRIRFDSHDLAINRSCVYADLE